MSENILRDETAPDEDDEVAIDDAIETTTTAIAAAAAPTLQEYIKVELPYPDERIKRMQTFYKKREKNPDRYTYSEKGELVFLDKSGAVEETIPLRPYVAWTAAEREERDQARLDAIGRAETAYEEAMEGLRAAQAEHAATGAIQPLLAAQKAVRDADSVLSRVRYGQRGIQLLPNPETRSVLFDQRYETRKLIPGGAGTKDPFGKELIRLLTLEVPYITFYGQYTDAPDAAGTTDITDGMEKPTDASEAATRQRLKDGRMARIFSEADDGPNGYLSPFWPVEFTMDDTKYFTALQAFEVARARELGNEALRVALLRTRSTRTMRFLTKKLDRQPKDVKSLWVRIFTAVYQQHPELKERLLATGTDALVFADLRTGPSGIGMGIREAGVLDPSRWKGENMVGAALESLRIQFREGTAAEAARTDAPTEAVITTEEQDAAKVGAIISAKRKFQFKRPGGTG